MIYFQSDKKGITAQDMISELTLHKTEVNNLTFYLWYFAHLRMDQVSSSVRAYKYPIMG